MKSSHWNSAAVKFWSTSTLCTVKIGKHFSATQVIKQSENTAARYGNGNWGLSIRTKERLKTTRDRSTPFGVVVTLKEMNGVNRIDDFIKLCMVRGWIVNRIDVDNRVDVYQKAEEEISFD